MLFIDNAQYLFGHTSNTILFVRHNVENNVNVQINATIDILFNNIQFALNTQHFQWDTHDIRIFFNFETTIR